MDFGPKIPYTLVRPKMPYRFGEVGEVSCGEIASSHGSALIGCSRSQLLLRFRSHHAARVGVG